MQPLLSRSFLPPSQAVLTLDALRHAQRRLAGLVTPVAETLDVPIGKAVGRVLAATAGDRPPVAPGTRLEARHLPLFAGRGHTMASVVARARVGVVALHDDPVDRDPHPAGTAATAAWVAATAERLGAQAFEAACRGPCPRRFLRTLEMFGDDCALVVTVGFLSPALCDAVRRVQAARGGPAGVETLSLRPVGALQVMRIGRTLVVAVAADLGSAVAAFTTLLTPLVRRLQGRVETLPPVLAAELVDALPPVEPRWSLFPVRADADPGGTRLRVRAREVADTALALAGADGLAWHSAGFGGPERSTVAYFPFDTWST